MISIIVCSRSAGLFDKFQRDVAVTIGVAYEVVRIDNTNSNYSICHAYNEGAEKAIFPYLCFVHEDVFFKTADWGKKLLYHFNAEPNAGLIGVAGAVFKSKMACGWWEFETGREEIRRMNILHTLQKSQADFEHLFFNPFNEIRSTVVLVDGVFIATTKDIWLNNRFDEKMLAGFHGYDLDFSFQVGQQKKLFVVYDILIEHFSSGKKDITWMNTMIMVHTKWRKQLPLAAVGYKANGEKFYDDSWKRLRKNMAAFMHTGMSIGPLVRKYNQYFALLDNKPGMFTLYKDYLRGLVKIIKVALVRKPSAR